MTFRAITSAALAAMQAAAISIGDFSYIEQTDPINDSLAVGVQLEAEGGTLTIACRHDRAKTVYVVLETKRFLTVAPHPLLRGMMSFQYRIDNAPAETALVEYGLDTIVVEGAQARAFAQRLATGSRVFIRVDGASDNIDLSFSSKGSREAIERVAQKCGDKRLIDRLSKNR